MFQQEHSGLRPGSVGVTESIWTGTIFTLFKEVILHLFFLNDDLQERAGFVLCGALYLIYLKLSH